MDSLPFVLLYRYLDESESSVSDLVTGGFAKDFSSYSNLVGRLREIRAMRDEVKNIEKRFIEE